MPWIHRHSEREVMLLLLDQRKFNHIRKQVPAGIENLLVASLFCAIVDSTWILLDIVKTGQSLVLFTSICLLTFVHTCLEIEFEVENLIKHLSQFFGLIIGLSFLVSIMDDQAFGESLFAGSVILFFSLFFSILYRSLSDDDARLLVQYSFTCLIKPEMMHKETDAMNPRWLKAAILMAANASMLLALAWYESTQSFRGCMERHVGMNPSPKEIRSVRAMCLELYPEEDR